MTQTYELMVFSKIFSVCPTFQHLTEHTNSARETEFLNAEASGLSLVTTVLQTNIIILRNYIS
jgi:hypothetical protein